MVVIKDIIEPRREVIEGRFQGVIQSHKVDAKEPRLENDPQEFFKITFPSLALKTTLERINEKLSGISSQGGSYWLDRMVQEKHTLSYPYIMHLGTPKYQKNGLGAGIST